MAVCVKMLLLHVVVFVFNSCCIHCYCVAWQSAVLKVIMRSFNALFVVVLSFMLLCCLLCCCFATVTCLCLVAVSLLGIYLAFHCWVFIWRFIVGYLFGVSLLGIYLAFHCWVFIWRFIVGYLFGVSLLGIYLAFHCWVFIWRFIVGYLFDVSLLRIYLAFHFHDEHNDFHKNPIDNESRSDKASD